MVNNGVIETMSGGLRGIQTQAPFINNGTIVSSPAFRVVVGSSNTGCLTNNGQIFSVLDLASGNFNGNAFEPLNSCPTISSMVTDVCIDKTITIVADKGTFTSNNPTIAEVDATTGIVTGKTPGTAKITVTDGACTIQRIVTVHPLPTPLATTLTICGYGLSDLTTNNTCLLYTSPSPRD